MSKETYQSSNGNTKKNVLQAALLNGCVALFLNSSSIELNLEVEVAAFDNAFRALQSVSISRDMEEGE